MNKIEYPLIQLVKKKESETIKIDEEKLINVDLEWLEGNAGNHRSMIQVRNSGPFRGRAFCLNSAYDWVTGIDCFGARILIPLPRK